MNLERILAENMARFGTKNLSSGLRHTLLNEGVKPGEAPATQPKYFAENYPLNRYTSENATIGKWLQPYDNVKNVLGETNKTLLTPAAIAAAYAMLKNLNSNKQLMKKVEGTPTIDGMLYMMGGDPGSAGAVSAIDINQLTPALSTVTYTSELVDVYPAPNSPAVATVGNGSAYGVSKQSQQTTTDYVKLLSYLNMFNLGNVYGDGSTVDWTQYDLSTMVNSDNYVDLLTSVTATNKLIMYSSGDKTPNIAGKEITTKTVGATAPIPKQYDVSFESDSTAIPANDPQVALAVQDAIAMFPDGNITNLTVLSSASPEYNETGGGPKTLADYGQTPITGTGDPGAGTGFIGKNIKLAYDRGVSFMAALNAGLEAQGKPAVSGYTIKWQISDKGGSKEPGRYAEVQWEKAGSKGTEVKGATSTGTEGGATDLKKTFNVRKHVFSW
jgi:hypothetical protein